MDDCGGYSYTEETEEYWNASVAKGFSWDEGDDTLGLPGLSSCSVSSEPDQLVCFEVSLPTSTGNADLEERVRQASKQISAFVYQPEASISEIVGKKSTDPAKLESELKTAKRALHIAHEKKFLPDPTIETVQNIVLGKPYSLEMYKSLKKKEDLLDCALELGDGDAILAISLMIKRTLKRSKFVSLICVRPLAVEHLINHMITRHELEQVIDLLVALGRHHDSGIVAYRQAIHAQNIEKKVRHLKQLLHSSLSCHEDAGLVMEQIHLLERVSPILVSESEFPDRPFSTLPSSVLNALVYLTQYHYNAPENLLHSPSALIKMHKLTKTQSVWVSVRGRATVHAWDDCVSLLVGKGWMGGVKAKVGINMVEMATVLHDAECPVEKLTQIVAAVDLASSRLEVATKLGVASVVVDILLSQKDKTALTRFRDSLTPNSRDWFYAENALSTSNVRWKT